jgi:hypothetical protein
MLGKTGYYDVIESVIIAQGSGKLIFLMDSSINYIAVIHLPASDGSATKITKCMALNIHLNRPIQSSVIQIPLISQNLAYV